jgi:hypothetical protein
MEKSKFITKFLRPKNKVNSIIIKILNNEVSKFEVISKINKITDNETFNLFFNEFEQKYQLISCEFFFNIKEEHIIDAVNSIQENQKIYLTYSMLCEIEQKTIKTFTRNINGIDCYFNTFGVGFSQNTNKKEYLFLNDLMIFYNNMKWETNFDFQETYNSFGDLNFLKIIYDYLKIKKESFTSSEQPEAIDLSDTTATEKIIYLHKLGVIDFLRKQEPFNYSINSLATVLSAVTGEKSVTIQPMLNPMLSEFNDQKNNPLKSKRPVSKVEQQLIKIGSKLK